MYACMYVHICRGMRRKERVFKNKGVVDPALEGKYTWKISIVFPGGSGTALEGVRHWRFTSLRRQWSISTALKKATD